MDMQNCEQCSMPFVVTRKHPDQRFCSRACSGKAIGVKLRLLPKVCPQCGITFPIVNSRAKFCSSRCSAIYGNNHRKDDNHLFWSKIEKTDTCWIWKGLIHRKYGYGRYCKKQAHRLAWIFTYGTIPNNLYVLHKCDNRRCCNPDHLFLGTHLDNVADMVRKERHTRGESHGHSKFTNEQVQMIRSSSLKQSELAERFGVNQSTISRIHNKKRWVHI
jgi:endogenous inhibitor of DNA gyrase (YacG/DUF329 family)